MENKAFCSHYRFGKWMREYHLGRSICKVLGVQAHMRQVQRRLSGRSMIEMLGVLAIIGVLSIGGLAAYRQAMMRHTANKIAQMINQAGFTFKELCPKDGACPLKVEGDDEWFVYNKKLMCDFGYIDFCGSNSINGGTVYSRWAFHLVSGTVQRTGAFSLRSLSPQFCSLILDYPFDGLRYVAVYAEGMKIFYPDNGRLNEAQRKELKEHCYTKQEDFDESFDLMIGFGFLSI